MGNNNRISQEILQSIKRDIVLGQIKPNKKLPSERKLSEQFGVGRGTIREILKTLEAIGLLIVVSGRSGGYFVTETANEISKQALYSSAQLESSILNDSLVFRKMFEPKTSYLAAINRSRHNLIQMRNSIRSMEKGSSNPDVYVSSNIDFHYEIAKASKNPFIIGIYPDFFKMLRETGKMVHHLPTQIEVTQFFHREIFYSIKNQEAERAEHLMDTHLSYVQNDMREGKNLKLVEAKQ
jgi:GntR family transcriptional regulator, transcriptional repressor for pyruvate dehydrogenase complex